eukprot:CAMPEP_0197591376 /NCGR_PEP_ID=MMETSP1326-20131121/13040_1 /TAXON_ID=1155430 /ORGANISM="Genus nov. species nov., Strain RCC2288" /LENGTH=647 /DNA_ID=CAMNT_0043156789 /DNA_START=57 /DNA_END=2000 /DNA_ORIENTATION=+
MPASENRTLIRMLGLLAVFVPVMLFGLYHTDVKKHGIFSESARDHVYTVGAGGLRSVDELRREFDPNGAHDSMKELPEDMKVKLLEMGYTEKQVLLFETMSVEQLVHVFDEASTVVRKALKVTRRDGTALVLPGLSRELEMYRKKQANVKVAMARAAKEEAEENEAQTEEDKEEAEAKRLQDEAEREAAAAAAAETKEAAEAEAEAETTAPDAAKEEEEGLAAAAAEVEAETKPPSKPSSFFFSWPTGFSGSNKKPVSPAAAATMVEKEEEVDWKAIKTKLFGDEGVDGSGENKYGAGKVNSGSDKAKASGAGDRGSSSGGSGGSNDALDSDAPVEETAGDKVVKMTADQKAAFLMTEEFATLSQALTPPMYCHRAVNGDKAEPTIGKMAKGLPAAKAAMKIAEIMAKERECWFVDKKCANDTRPHLLDGRGRRWVNKFMSKDQTLEEIWDNIPELGLGELGTCALIGSADNMLKKNWGKQIDSHDFVVRFNSVMKGFEKDIGTKTDGLWQKPSYQGSIGGSQKPRLYYMIPKDIPLGFEKSNGARIVAYGPALPKWRADIKNIYDIYKKDKKITKGTPTGGLARMISLMESGACSRVDIYGFSGGGGKYFKKSAVVKEEHIISVEHYIRRLMMSTGIVGKVCVYGQ